MGSCFPGKALPMRWSCFSSEAVLQKKIWPAVGQIGQELGFYLWQGQDGLPRPTSATRTHYQKHLQRLAPRCPYLTGLLAGHAGRCTASRPENGNLKAKFLGRIFLRHGCSGQKLYARRLFPKFFGCVRQGVAGMSRDLDRDVPGSEKLCARNFGLTWRSLQPS